MLTISLENLYYIVSMISILCGASFSLGLYIGKHTKK